MDQCASRVLGGLGGQAARTASGVWVVFWLWAHVAGAAMVGGPHDFVDNGFTGGGVCAACHYPHNAQDQRLYPRDNTGSGFGVPKRLCMDCHDGTLPTGDGWDTVTGVTPPPFPHGTSAVYDACTQCHSHRRGFVIPNEDCLECHTTSANGGVFDDTTQANLEVDRYFNGIGYVNDSGILSQHNIQYAADGNFDTSEDASQNECKKCHGWGGKHPTDAAFLVYPDDVPGLGKVAGDPIARSSDYSAYQSFCLACHDGVDEGPADAWRQEFNGTVPPGQVPPSDRTDPSNQQAAAPWVVPAVPPKDVNAGSPYTSGPPFFEYYETNGHGLDTSAVEENPMNVTCLAGGAGQGCHNPHGTPNRFLADALFGTGLDTVGEFVQSVCYGCHVEADLTDPDKAILQKNDFHGWSEDRPGLHIPVGVGMVRWRAISEGWSMWIADPFQDPNGAGVFPDAYAETAILPFYSGTTGPVEDRVYAPTLGTDWVSCLTCHDPHGTAPTAQFHTGTPDDTGPETTEAMLRKFPVTWDYTDALCGECHSAP